MPKSVSYHFRNLDNIAYVSLCLLLMHQSSKCDDSNNDKNNMISKLLNLRKEICGIIELLSKHSLLFSKDFNSLQHSILQNEFLTYDKNDGQTWCLHLVAGILLCFWCMKS